MIERAPLIEKSKGGEVLVMEPIHPAGIDLLSRTHRVNVLTGPGDHNLVRLAASAQALIVRSTQVTSELIARMPSLKVVGRHGAGLDNIDQGALRDRGIALVNTPHSNADSVAEYVITVSLMLLKRIGEATEALRRGTFRQDLGSLPGQVDRNGLVGRDAAGLNLGLVGFGAIGQAVSWRARALGMNVLAVDPYQQARVFDEQCVERLTELNDLLPSVDVLTLHTPAVTGAPPLIAGAELGRMQRESVLVNAARGQLVDARALARVLNNGYLAGAAIDVYDSEPPLADHPLLDARNVILTPHMAAMTDRSLKQMSRDVCEAVSDILNGQIPTSTQYMGE